jgi:hypothetical protein
MVSDSTGAPPGDTFEAFLSATLTLPLPVADARVIDDRVTPLLDQGRSSGRRSRISVRALVLVAAAFLVLGATTSLLSIYGTFGGDRWQYAWQHATRLGLTQTHHGYSVTLEAAYGDASRLMLAVSLVDAQNRGWSQLDASSAEAHLAGETGPTYRMSGGGSTPASSGSANTVWLDAVQSPTPGVHTVIVTVPEIRYRDPNAVDHTGDWWHAVPGPWTFHFDLPIASGTH